MLETIGRPKLRDIVAERLKSFIVTENLRAGDKLPTETELAAQFGVSRLSLREATKALEFLGIVEAHPRTGADGRRREYGTGHRVPRLPSRAPFGRP